MFVVQPSAVQQFKSSACAIQSVCSRSKLIP